MKETGKRIEDVFAEKVILLREKNNISQQELANEIGITRQSLSLYENGQRTIRSDVLLKIADFFNVTTDYLLGKTAAQTIEADTRAVCDYIGLSEKAVENIRLLTTQEGMKYDVFNYLLERDEALIWLIVPYMIGKSQAGAISKARQYEAQKGTTNEKEALNAVLTELAAVKLALFQKDTLLGKIYDDVEKQFLKTYGDTDLIDNKDERDRLISLAYSLATDPNSSLVDLIIHHGKQKKDGENNG